jgi:hypothetical protein
MGNEDLLGGGFGLLLFGFFDVWAFLGSSTQNPSIICKVEKHSKALIPQ